MRNEYKKKSDIHIFEEDDGCTTIEKDYISFKYKGIEVQDNYESDEHDLGSCVFEICSIIDSGEMENFRIKPPFYLCYSNSFTTNCTNCKRKIWLFFSKALDK